MSLSWISKNSNLQAGITLINSLHTPKFVLLLQHIIQSKPENMFTPDELQKLEESFELSSANVQLLIQSVVYILKQSSKVILKPTVLQKQLVDDLQFNSDKAEEFVKVWTSKTKEDFGNLENRKKVEKVGWELNLQTSSSAGPKEATPNIRMKFGLANVKGPEKENIVFELNEEELLQMYSTLENIQSKLDLIQNTT